MIKANTNVCKSNQARTESEDLFLPAPSLSWLWWLFLEEVTSQPQGCRSCFWYMANGAGVKINIFCGIKQHLGAEGCSCELWVREFRGSYPPLSYQISVNHLTFLCLGLPVWECEQWWLLPQWHRGRRSVQSRSGNESGCSETSQHLHCLGITSTPPPGKSAARRIKKKVRFKVSVGWTSL